MCVINISVQLWAFQDPQQIILEISLSLLGLYSSALHVVSIVEVRRGGRFDPRIRRLFVDLIESVLNGWIGK